MLLHLSIITPERIAFEGDVASVTLPTGDGEITVLPRHIPVVTTAVPGSLIARDASGEHLFAISRGTIEVNAVSVQVLVRSADSADELGDEEAIRQAKEAAEKLMQETRADSEGFAEASAVLDRELARSLSVKRKSSVRRARLPRSDNQS